MRVPIPPGVFLSDSDFHQSDRIDLLIGAGLFWDLLCVDRIRVGLGNLVWQKTRLGWILGGRLPWPRPPTKAKQVNVGHAVTNAQLERAVPRFWEVQEVATTSLSQGSDPFEEHFCEQITRDEQGRFVVGIPFNQKVFELGESFTQATGRFLNLERKFRRNPELANQYRDFLRQYIELGHMQKIEIQNDSGQQCYLPHHAVVRESSTITKLRVVFDGSTKTSTGVYLNDAQLGG